jgi:hypothetical protein
MVTTGTISPRQGRPAPEGPFEGVPHYLRPLLTGWVEQVFVIKDHAYYSETDQAGIDQLAAILQIELTSNIGRKKLETIFDWADDDERFLDVLHYTLQVPTQKDKQTERLEALLASGKSVWRATEKGLERRVDPIATAAFEQTVSPQDAASEELAEAWGKAYGRNPDASDAWDHSIKAVEAILRRIISPSNTQATLGTLIRDLRNGAHKFKFVLTNDFGGVETLLAMMELMWPNPDRHGDLQQRHTPSLEEARAVVQLAVTIVQWARERQIVKR